MNKFKPNKLWEDCLKLEYVEFFKDHCYKFNSVDYHKLPMSIPNGYMLLCDKSLLNSVHCESYNRQASESNNLVYLSTKS